MILIGWGFFSVWQPTDRLGFWVGADDLLLLALLALGSFALGAFATVMVIGLH
jgi:hypothetical protein